MLTLHNMRSQRDIFAGVYYFSDFICNTQVWPKVVSWLLVAHCFAMHRTSLAFRIHKFINETAAKLNSDSNLKIIIPGTPCWNGLFIIRVTENQSEVFFFFKKTKNISYF